MKTETVNIDHHLDITNAVDEYISKSQDSDTSFFIFYNEEMDVVTLGMGGCEETICAILSNEDNWVNITSAEGLRRQKVMQKVVLNAALNIIRVNPSFKKKFKSVVNRL